MEDEVRKAIATWKKLDVRLPPSAERAAHEDALLDLEGALEKRHNPMSLAECGCQGYFEAFKVHRPGCLKD